MLYLYKKKYKGKNTKVKKSQANLIFAWDFFYRVTSPPLLWRGSVGVIYYFTNFFPF